MRSIKIIVFISFITSCNSNGNKEQHLVAENDTDTIKNYDTGTSDPKESLSSCYESTNGKDTVSLSVFSSSKVITGALNYHYYGKDNNNGTIRGMMHGDTLIADYIFMSEGKASIRQVAFLKRDSAFIEGYGEAEEQDHKMVFKDRNRLSFTGIPLHMVDCTAH